MSGREWKTGDVANTLSFGVQPAFRTSIGWTYIDGSTASLAADEHDYRPLVVIDPEDEATLRKFAAWTADGDYADWRIQWVQDFLRSLIAPPKPPEPQGLGAVVENDQGRLFIRQHDGWWRGDEPCTLNWSAVHAVRVLSEGVAS